jgi:hypothetical protein
MSPEPETDESRLWLWVAILLPLYAFLYDNATSLPAAMGSSWTRLTSLPREVRLVEIAVIAGLLSLALTHGVSRLSRYLLVGLLAFVGLGLASYLRSTDLPLVDGVRLIYMWVLPIVIFIIGREAPWGRRAWWRVARLTGVWIVASAVVSWVQFGVLGYPVGDDITGFNKDAHVNGTLFMVMALNLFAVALFYGRWSAALAGLALLVTMVLSSVLKVLFLGVFAVVVLAVLFLQSKPQRHSVVPRGLKWGIAGILAVILVGGAFSQIDDISSSRLGDLAYKVRDDPGSLGPIQAHTVAATRVFADLRTLTFGLGLYRYANPISVGQVLDQGRLGQMAESGLMAINDEKGEQARVTLSSSLLAEFGVPAFLIAALWFAAIGHAVWQCRRSDRLDIRTRSAGLLAAGVILLTVPLTSLFGSLDVMSVSWPLMLLSGLLCREAAVGG